MRRLPRLATASLLTTLIGACSATGSHRQVTFDETLPRAGNPWQTWDEVFAAPTRLNVTAYQTGRVLTGPEVLIDAQDPGTPAEAKVQQWVPALSYLVQHPRVGRFLMDTGLPRADARGEAGFGLPPLVRFPGKAQPDQNIADQLQREGLRPADLRFVLLSHLHGDHAGGLRALSEKGHVTIALLSSEWQAASRPMGLMDGYFGSLLQTRYDVAVIPPSGLVEMPIMGKALDLFGDGSTWLFPLTGHTQGELSALLNTASGPLLFTFDASHLQANTEHAVPPGFTVDKAAARDAVKRLQAFHRAYPQVRMIYGHDPGQWRPEDIRVELVQDLPPGT